MPAIGGKTGVNLPLGKNLVGTIHQPARVICDVEVLSTLPFPLRASKLFFGRGQKPPIRPVDA